MFFELARILEQTKPPLCLFENVKGLLSHDKGKTFETIIYTLDELGYDVEWQVLNSKDFGVPQSRERVYIVGHFRGERTRKVFSYSGTRSEANEIEYATTVPTRYRGTGGETYIACKPKVLKIGGGSSQGNRVYSSEGLVITQQATGGGLGAKTGLYQVKEKIQATPVLTPNREKKRQNGRRFKAEGDPMFTLTAQDRHGVLMDDNGRYRIRRLTPRECWRLQGFPDWAFNKAKATGLSDSQLYKQAGNAVTVNVIQWIGERLYHDGKANRKIF